MATWNPFKKKQQVVVTEKKSWALPQAWFLNGGNAANNQITIKRALQFYDNAAPVATAIDWINDEFKTLSLLLKDGDNVVADSEILKFMRQPNQDMTQEDFLENLGAYFLIANEVYIVAYGNINRAPADLVIVSPEYITIKMASNGFVGQITIQQSGHATEVFKRDENAFRFYNKDKSAEIWQIKGFSGLGDSLYSNSQSTGNSLTSSRGRSKLSSIHREINQYIQVATHNLSVLDNGMVPSGSIEMPEGVTLDDDQFERLREQIINFYSGSKNAGKTLILDNGMKFVPMSLNAKDMDFKELTKTVTITIFNRYKVPLPLISAENMTLANMDAAKHNLYDNCVIPMASRLLRELTNFLAPRFNLSENALIIADLDEVSALQLRRNEQLKLKKELNVYTINEIRADAGDDEISDGGDIVYIANNMIPAGTEMIPPTNPMADVTPDNEDGVTRDYFVALMQKQVDVNGNRTLSDIEINEIADIEGL